MKAYTGRPTWLGSLTLKRPDALVGLWWKGYRKEPPKGAVFYRFLTGTETLLAQIDAGGMPVGRHPCRPPEHGKVVVDGFRMLGSMGWVIRYPRMIPKQVVLGNYGGSYNDCFCFHFR